MKSISTALAAREWNGTLIRQRQADGFINATAMCQANGKRWNNYYRMDRTQAYIAALAASVGSVGIPTTGQTPCAAAVARNRATGFADVIDIVQGGNPQLQGTWIHPRLAIDFARWISPQFAVWMDGWFLEWLQGTSTVTTQQELWEDATWLRSPNRGKQLTAYLAYLVDSQARGRANVGAAVHHVSAELCTLYPLPTLQSQLAPVVGALRDVAAQLEQLSLQPTRYI